MNIQINGLLPFFKNASVKIQQEFEKYTCPKNYNKHQHVALEGDDCHYFYIVLSGEVRVYKGSECGREVTLYKVKTGESCILSAFCILNKQRFPANAVVDKNARVLEIPAPILRDWINRYDFWRKYIFNLLTTHLTQIISKVESLVFQRVDERIANFLVNSTSHNQKRLKMTHSDIARELGTAREVVSRILKNFEKASLVSLSRGSITILDQQALLNHGKFYSYAS